MGDDLATRKFWRFGDGGDNGGPDDQDDGQDNDQPPDDNGDNGGDDNGGDDNGGDDNNDDGSLDDMFASNDDLPPVDDDVFGSASDFRMRTRPILRMIPAIGRRPITSNPLKTSLAIILSSATH